MKRLYVIGMGPGGAEQLTPQALRALEDSRENNLAVEKLFTPYIWAQEMALHLFSVLILAAAVWLWASRMLPQPVYEPETFTQARWEELDDRGVLVDSLLEQYDGLEGMDLAEVQALLGEHPYTREDPEVGMYRDGYYIGAGRENSGREEVMVLQFRDGEVIRVEFEDAG